MTLTDEDYTIFQLPHFGEANTPEELQHQLAILSSAIERCEKMLQHLAVSNFNQGAGDLDYFITKHLELIGMKNKLYSKWQGMSKSSANTTSSSVPDAISKNWWQFWK